MNVDTAHPALANISSEVADWLESVGHPWLGGVPIGCMPADLSEVPDANVANIPTEYAGALAGWCQAWQDMTGKPLAFGTGDEDRDAAAADSLVRVWCSSRHARNILAQNMGTCLKHLCREDIEDKIERTRISTEPFLHAAIHISDATSSRDACILARKLCDLMGFAWPCVDKQTPAGLRAWKAFTDVALLVNMQPFTREVNLSFEPRLFDCLLALVGVEIDKAADGQQPSTDSELVANLRFWLDFTSSARILHDRVPLTALGQPVPLGQQLGYARETLSNAFVDKVAGWLLALDADPALLGDVLRGTFGLTKVLAAARAGHDAAARKAERSAARAELEKQVEALTARVADGDLGAFDALQAARSELMALA